MVIEKLVLVVLVFSIGASGSGKQPPSAAEFNLFCRILTVANDMILEPDYVYHENVDREILNDMEVLYNATTENMDTFRKTLWETKDFLEAHPPPIGTQNRREAHREIGRLIKESERKIQESRQKAVEVNNKIKEARLSAAQGIYGDDVKDVPKEEGKLTSFLGNTGSIFVNGISAAHSCGNESGAGKTLINDIFCVCVGEGRSDSAPPCHDAILPPKKAGKNCGSWSQMKYKKDEDITLNLTESIVKIEGVCRISLRKTKLTKNIPDLLVEFLEMIGKGDEKVKTNKERRIFGHSGRPVNRGEVTECTGTGVTGNSGQPDYHNDKMCVDYKNNLNGENNYDIPWHKRFTEAFGRMNEAKALEDVILQNHAEILLLKSKAWIAYSREKEDETTNLDDMNVSHLFDGSRILYTISFSLLFLIL
ncbi:Variant surface glycoprotein [Trypanosoma congolense IL3000]|uniref:Variant surface glycoprotein n=1 Tax=Trypanosoma congolense (strain IL3000) TaxID=1068625 RepID=F9WBW0_TRYCI|nr:Variant surface glycoprotein [Trypanosoma congolense IL3000]